MSEIGTRIDRILGLGLSGYLKGAGFHKRARCYRRVESETVSVLEIQLSRANLGMTGRFAMNVGIYAPALARFEGSLPLTAPKLQDSVIRQRFGGGSPEAYDPWWDISPGTDDEALAAAVQDVAANDALPWLAERRNLRDLREALDPNPSLKAAGIELLLGDPMSAARTARAFLERRPAARDHVQIWAARHGLSLERDVLPK